MNSWRQLVAIGVVLGMLHLTTVDVTRSAESTTILNPEAVKQQVDQLGVGAKVKMRLVNGKKLNGTIQSIEDGTFHVASKESLPTPVAYEQVAQLRLAKNTYKSKGLVDVDEARRVVAGLGVGKHIMVKTTAGKEYHGNIQTIGVESFTMLPDRQAASVQIAYNEAVQLGPNLSTGAKVALVVGGIIVVWLIVWAAMGAPR